MTSPVVPDSAASRRWGTRSALSDETDARTRLIEAAIRCIIQRGNADFRMAEVADEAGVTRSTLYRYFAARDELLRHVMVYGADETFAQIASSLPEPDDAARSIPALILEPISMVDGTNPLIEAFFAPGSRALVTLVELDSELMVDTILRHWAPLFFGWQADGQVHADLDLRETCAWMNAIALILLMPPWRDRSLDDKRSFIRTYLVRALLSPEAQIASEKTG